MNLVTGVMSECLHLRMSQGLGFGLGLGLGETKARATDAMGLPGEGVR